jgi:hypothetical protein
MKDVLSVFTFAIGALFLVVFFSTLKPTAMTAAVGGTDRADRCSFSPSPAPVCQPNVFAAASWSVAAMVTVGARDRLPPSH